MDNYDDEDIGYCKPPKSGQFKKGQSGNPKGRPKKDPPDPFFVELKNEIDKEVQTQDKNGNNVTYTKKEIIIKKLLHDAMNGDKRSMELLVRITKNREDFCWI